MSVTKDVKRIRVAELRAGMQTAEPVVTTRGRVLFESGVTLTERHLHTLKAWGIPDVAVHGSEEDFHTVPDQRPRSEIEHALLYLFQRTDLEDPVVQTLFRLACARRQEQDERHVESASVLSTSG